jgi:hypothetical protein
MFFFFFLVAELRLHLSVSLLFVSSTFAMSERRRILQRDASATQMAPVCSRFHRVVVCFCRIFATSLPLETVFALEEKKYSGNSERLCRIVSHLVRF